MRRLPNQSMTNQPQSSHSARIAIILLAGLTLATFHSVINCQFINVDDVSYVTMNDHVLQGLNLHNVWWALTSLEVGNWHPVTWLSHMLDAQIFDRNPAGHHFTSLLIHILNVLLLFFFLRYTTHAVWKSTFVSALFAVHPLALESVAFIAERKNVLSTMFLLLTLLAYAWYARKPGTSRYLVFAIFFALGLMAKPMLVTVPFALLLLDYWPLGRFTATASVANEQPPSSPSFGQLCLEKLPLLCMSAVSSLLTLKAQALDREIKIVPLVSRIANALYSYGIYLKQMVWPTDLAILYPYRDLPIFSASVVSSAVLVLAVTGLAVWQLKKRPYIAVGWFWYLGTLVPVIGLVHVGDLSHGDRYTYVPLVGVFIVIIWSAAEWITRFPSLRFALLPAGTLAVLALAVVANKGVANWHDGITIAEHSLAVTGSNCLMERSLGEALFSKGYRDEALQHFSRSVQEQPTDAALYDIGTIKLQQRKPDEAFAYFQQALQYPGENHALSQIHNTLAVLYMQRGLLPEAEQHFQKSLALEPGSARHHLAYGWLLAQESRYAEAAVQYELSLRVDPNGMVYYYLGSALEQEHRYDEAIAAYRKTLQMAPQLQDAQLRLNAIAAIRH